VCEGEFLCNSTIGFNFDDGHLHNEDLIKAVQSETEFEPGECASDDAERSDEKERRK
jgi:hypothetical protein